MKSAYLSRIAQKFDLFVVSTRFRPRINIAADVFRARSGGISSTQSSLTPQVGMLLPTGASAGFSWARNDRFQDGRRFSGEVSAFSVSQPLLRGAGPDVNLAPIRRARLQERINRLGLKNTVSNVVSSIVFAYRDLIQAQEQIRLAELALQRTKDLLETNRALIAAGRMAAADIVQTESGVANQEVALLQAGQTKTSAQLSLLQLLALDPRTNIVAGDGIDTDHVTIDLDKALDLGRSARMDVLSSELAVEQSQISLREAKNNRLWDLSATGSVSRFRGSDALQAPLDGNTDNRVGLTLNIPIGDYAPRQGEINATVALRQAELNYQDTSQSAESQIRDAVQSVEASWLQLEAARRARSLAARALDLQREKLKFGRASNFEVLSFEADLRAADAQELSSKINYLNQLTSLDQQIGSTLDTWKIDLND
nr:TolC family protein [Sphingomonas sp. So64.6b]